MESGLEAVTLGSSWRSDPAAAFRGLAKAASPAALRVSFRCSKAERGRYTSPRTSIRPGASSIRIGIALIVRRFWVTFSPTTPSPRVAPRSKTPST
jgi:hypothetical protein